MHWYSLDFVNFGQLRLSWLSLGAFINSTRWIRSCMPAIRQLITETGLILCQYTVHWRQSYWLSQQQLSFLLLLCLCKLAMILTVWYDVTCCSATVWWRSDHIPWHTGSRCFLCYEGSWCYGHWYRSSSCCCWRWSYETDSWVNRLCQRC